MQAQITDVIFSEISSRSQKCEVPWTVAEDLTYPTSLPAPQEQVQRAAAPGAGFTRRCRSAHSCLLREVPESLRDVSVAVLCTCKLFFSPKVNKEY